MWIRSWLRRFNPNWTVRFPYACESKRQDYVRLRLTRLEDRIVFDAAGVVVDIQPGAGSAAPAELTPFNQAIYFSATGVNSSGEFVGRELYRLDANGSVHLVADINRGSADSNPADFALFDGKLVFAATGTLGREIYQLDTAGNVSLVADINPGIPSSSPVMLTDFNDKLYFSAIGSAGREIYVINRGGNASLVADLNPGPSGSDPSAFTSFAGNLYFTATGPNGRILYRESPSGTSDPAAINLGPGVTDPQHFAEFNGRLYFSAHDPTDGRELYALRVAGNNRDVVAQVANIDGTPSDSSPSEFFVFGDALYFAAQGQNGRELFRLETDGDLAELDLARGAASSSPADFTVFNEELYFAATVDGQRGLWRLVPGSTGFGAVSIPLPPGVTLPADIAFHVLDDQLYFAAIGSDGRELYRLEANGVVVQAADVNAGPANSNPSDVILFAGKTYFVATDANVGRELFVLRHDPSSIRIIGDRLVFTDEDGDRNNRIVVASDGLRLIIRDENGHAIGLLTPLAGATGSGTSEVFLPFTSISSIDAFELDTRGGNDSVTFQLSTHADTILGQFSHSIVDGGTNSAGSVGDLLRFIGDGATDSIYTPDGGITGNGVVVVSNSAHATEFAFVHIEPIEFTGMAEATLMAPVTASGADRLQVSEGLDLLNGSIATLVVSGNVGGTPIESVRFYANETVILDTGSGVDGADELTMVGAGNSHRNTNLILNTGPSGAGSSCCLRHRPPCRKLLRFRWPD